MNHSPLFYPLNRGMDAEAGGAADLQTDVMRFMAIILMCLVAIFALVQSIPLAPVPLPVETPPQIREAVADVSEPVDAEIETELVLTRPPPARMKQKEAPVALQRPQPKPPAGRTEAVVQDRAAAALVTRDTDTPDSNSSSVPRGFSLRFESDTALTRLVARQVVGLYAIAKDKTHRMNIEDGEMSFWNASAPQRFHEMDVATVPGDLLSAYRRSNPGGGTAIKWGVSIPAGMSQQLNQYLNELEGGSLVIGLDGQLRLEE